MTQDEQVVEVILSNHRKRLSSIVAQYCDWFRIDPGEKAQLQQQESLELAARDCLLYAADIGIDADKFIGRVRKLYESTMVARDMADELPDT